MRTPLIAATALLALVACSTEDHETWEDVPICSASLVEAMPEDGEAVIGTNAEVVLLFEGQVPGLHGASLVTDPPADCSYVVEGDEVVFSPDELLDRETEYAWTAALCAEEAASGIFTTRWEGELLEDPSVLAGRTFSMDLTDAEWLEPEGGGGLVSGLFAGVFLLGIQEVLEHEIDIIFAVGEDVGGGVIQQDPCYETVDFEPADFTRNPYFELGPKRMPLEVQGQAVMLDDVQISGALVDDGTDLTDAELIANADARQFGDWEYVCGMLDVFGAPCQACSDGVEACVGLHVAQIEGAAQGGVVIQEVTDPGAECDPGTDTKE